MKHLIWLTLLAPVLSFAGNTPKTVHHFDNGDTISLTLSSLDVNTLRVSHDRIVSITCPPGFCSSQTNPKDKFGTVNVNIGIQAPFTAQVATEKGRLFALLVSPKAVPGKIVELTYNQSHLDEPSYFERGFDYPIALTEFTKVMMRWRQHPAPISGVRIHHVDPDTLPKDDGPLFLSSAAEQHASLRPLISMWLAIASNAILGLKPDDNRRVWVLMDEMPSLHRLPELGSIISEVRKFGGCYVIGIQSYAQLEKTYGKTAAQEMFDLLNTRFFFRAPSNAMASISSKELGEQEVDLSKENISYGANALRDGVSIGHETKMRPIVTASEIQALDDLECYLRVPGSAYVTKLDLFYDKLKNPNPGFIKREFTTSPGMVSAYEKAVFLETVAPGLYLSDKDRQSLTAIQASQFETDEEMKIETNQMNEAQKGDTFKAILTNEKGGQSEIEKVSNSEYQAQAQRQLDEAAISQDIGEMGD